MQGSTLVVIAHELIEQPHAPARAPALVDLGLRRAERGAGDVEMRPRRLADEALQHLRRRDRAAPPSAGVLHVREFRVDHLVVFGPERHAPHPLAGLLAGLAQPLREAVLIGEQTGIFLTERDDDRAGQRGEIDHEFRLVFGVDVVEHVGEHQPAFRIGIDDLDGLARHRLDDVAGPLRLAVRHVLHEPDRADRVDLRLAGGQRLHQSDHAGGARHVALHVLHVGGRLDRNAAGIEAHALADERNRRGAALAALPAHHHHATVVRGTLADAEQRVHAELRHRADVEHLDGDAEPLEGAGPAGELGRKEHVGRLVDEVAGKHDPVGHRLLAAPGGAHAGRIADADLDLHRSRLLLVLLALGLVPIERIGPQAHALREVARLLRRHRPVRQFGHDRRRFGAGWDFAHGDAAQLEEVLGFHLGRLATADHDQPGDRQVRRRHQVEAGSALALETVGAGGAGDQVRRRAEQAACIGPEFEPLVAEHDENTGRRSRKWHKCNGRALGHQRNPFGLGTSGEGNRGPDRALYGPWWVIRIAPWDAWRQAGHSGQVLTISSGISGALPCDGHYVQETCPLGWAAFAGVRAAAGWILPAGSVGRRGTRRAMGSIGRYIFRTTLGAFALILVSLTAVMWIATALRDIDLMTNQGQTVLVFIGITALVIPGLVQVLAPIALVVAAAHVLNKLANDSEIIVMNAAGMSPWRLFRAFIAAAAMVAALVLAMSTYVSPKCLRELRRMAAEVRADFVTNIVQPGRFIPLERGLTFHIRERRQDGVLLGVFVDDRRDDKEQVTILADEGQIIQDNTGTFLFLHSGSAQRHRADSPDPTIVLFERYAFDLSRLAGSPQAAITYSVRERYSWELFAPDPKDPLLAK